MKDLGLTSFYIHRKVESIFEGDNLRYLTELRGSHFSRFFYNKPTILINEIGRFLSFYSPALYFGQSILIIFFPFWLMGIIDLIKNKKAKVFLILFLAGIPVYLIDQRSFIFTLPIFLVYAYITYLGLKEVIKKWQRRE